MHNATAPNAAAVRSTDPLGGTASASREPHGPGPTLEDVRTAVEVTQLGFNADRGRVADVAMKARAAGVVGVCVAGVYVPTVQRILAKSETRTVAVANFPFGDHTPEMVAREIAKLREMGAEEIDFVVPVASALRGEWEAVREMIEIAVEAANGTPTKAIIETAAVSEASLPKLVRLAREAGVDFLKTSSGFHPSGGATVKAVRAVRELAPEMGLKASGGIRTLEQAVAMIAAGADRIGTSSTSVMEALARRGGRISALA